MAFSWNSDIQFNEQGLSGIAIVYLGKLIERHSKVHFRFSEKADKNMRLSHAVDVILAGLA